jgi:hypothetical protein
LTSLVLKISARVDYLKMMMPFLAKVASGVWLATTLSSGELNFDLGNGSVKLENPMEVLLPQGTNAKLQDPRFLGSGGGGAVFGYSWREPPKGSSSTSAVVKISWLRSATSVRNECQILQLLQKRQVSGVETCLASLDYSDDPRRAMIVLEPLVEESVSTVSELPPKLQAKAVDQLIRTMIQMLAANVVTTDVQALISTNTGDVLLMDMTEARVMTTPPTFVDIALVGSFCSEIFNLVPEKLVPAASTSLVSELMKLEATGDRLSKEVYDVLQGQTILSEEALGYLDKF